MKWFLKHITNVSWVVGIVLATLTLLLWIPDFISEDAQYLPLIGSLMFVIGNALLLMLLFYRAGVTRNRSSLPIYIYMLLMSVMQEAHHLWYMQLLIFMVLLSLLLLLQVSRNENATEESFLITALLCLSSLITPQILCFIPLVWLYLISERAFSLKTFIATLLAVGCFAIYIGVSFALGWLEWDSHLSVLQEPMQCMQLAGLILCTLFFVIFSFVGYSRQNLPIQGMLLFLLGYFVLSSILCFFPLTGFYSLEYVIVLCLAAYSSYCFQKTESVANGVIFILYNVVLWGQGIVQLFIE